MQSLGDGIGNISVVGLDRLGTALAACLAEKGFQVVGFDEDKSKRKMFQKGLAPVIEPGLEELLTKNRARLKAASNYYNLVTKTDITFVTQPGSQEPTGAFSTKNLEKTLGDIAVQIKVKEASHIIVVMGTSLPGTFDQVILPLLEEKSGKECGAGLGLCYVPDFTTPGMTIQNLLQPDIVFFGESDVDSGNTVANVLKNLVENKSPVLRMNFINAELARLARETYLATKISFSHLFAELCEKLPGADWSFLLKTLGLDAHEKMNINSWLNNPFDSRFVEENMALRYLCSQYVKTVPLVEAVDSLLKRQVHRIVDIIFRYLPDGGRVGILGLASSPNTDQVKNSQGVKLATWLYKQDIPVTVYDPLAMANAREMLDDKVTYAGSKEECVANCDVIVLTLPLPEFGEIPVQVLEEKINRPIFLDCCHILDEKKYSKYAYVLTPGMGDFILKPKRSRAEYDYSLVDLLSISNIHPN